MRKSSVRQIIKDGNGEKLITDYRSGAYTVDELCKKYKSFGYTKGVVYRFLKVQGVTKKHANLRTSKPSTSKRIAIVTQWLREGRTLKWIARQLDITHQAVNDFINSHRICEGELKGAALIAKSRKVDRHLKFIEDRGYHPAMLKDDFHRACRQIFRRKRQNCKGKKIPFKLKLSDVEFSKVCPVLGIELDYTKIGKRQENSPSFDRLDPKKGYVKGNVYIISWRANRIKNDGSADEHFKVYEYMTGIKKSRHEKTINITVPRDCEVTFSIKK